MAGPTLIPFKDLQARAEARKGPLADLLPAPTDADALAAIPDDRWLSDATKRVFQAGFNWGLIEQKWPRFEEVFEGFDLRRWRMMSKDDLDRILKSEGIVRNAQKIQSVQVNAELFCEMSEASGGLGRAFAACRPDDFADLLLMLQKRGARLGGATGQWFLRSKGVDGFALTKDVTEALLRERVIERPAKSAGDIKAVQAAFSQWRRESGFTLTQISKTLAFTVESTGSPTHTPL